MSPIAAAADGYEAPTVSDFWQPLFGTEGAFAVTRPAVVFLLSAIGFWVAGVVTYFGGFVMTIFEILVEFLQAYIFTLLTAVYVAESLHPEH